MWISRSIFGSEFDLCLATQPPILFFFRDGGTMPPLLGPRCTFLLFALRAVSTRVVVRVVVLSCAIQTQGWAVSSIFEEYTHFASPKDRLVDQRVRNNVALLFCYVQKFLP